MTALPFSDVHKDLHGKTNVYLSSFCHVQMFISVGGGKGVCSPIWLIIFLLHIKYMTCVYEFYSNQSGMKPPEVPYPVHEDFLTTFFN